MGINITPGCCILVSPEAQGFRSTRIRTACPDLSQSPMLPSCRLRSSSADTPRSPSAHAAQVAGGSEMRLEKFENFPQGRQPSTLGIKPIIRRPKEHEQEYDQEEDKSLVHERRFVVIVGVRPLQFPRVLDPVNASSSFVSSLHCFGGRVVEFARFPPSTLPRHGSTRGCQS